MSEINDPRLGVRGKDGKVVTWPEKTLGGKQFEAPKITSHPPTTLNINTSEGIVHFAVVEPFVDYDRIKALEELRKLFPKADKQKVEEAPSERQSQKPSK